MNAYLYHMLLKAKEVWYYNKSRPMGIDSKSCPFCIADCANAYAQAQNHMVGVELECWSCPLLSTAKTHDQQLEILHHCEEYGKRLLREFENSAGPVPEEEILC